MQRHVLAIIAALGLVGCSGSTIETSNLQPLTGEAASSAMLAPETARPDPMSMADTPRAPSPLGGAVPAMTTTASPIATTARIQFAPVSGAAAEALPALSLRLAERAAQRGLPVVKDGSGTHFMQGYFSAFTANRETTVVYVWDVLDPAGNRLHRIQGQQKAASGGAEGWASVTEATMRAIGDRTIDDLARWLEMSAT